MTQIEALKKYEIDLKIDGLKKQLSIIEKNIEDNLKKLDDSKDQASSYNTELKMNRIKYSRLELIIKRHEIESKIIELNELLKNDEIALINSSETLEGKYNIYKIDDQNKVGYITYSPNEYETEIGSIGYSILSPYRGNNYAYKSLKLLTSYLSSKGVDKISIVANLDNTNSIRVMEKFKKDAKETINESDKYKSIKKYTYSI